MSRSKRIGIGAAIVVIAAIATGIGVGAANAADLPPGAPAAQLVTPDVTSNGKHFYTDSQVDTVWRAVVSHYPAALPAGVSFPTTAPGIFHPSDSRKHLFQEGLPDMIAGQYWRCAWLNASISDTREAKTSVAKVDSQELSKYATLPSVATHLDLKALKTAVDNYAKASGKSAAQAEFDMQCPGLFPERANR